MPFNASDIITNPLDTIFTPFYDILGNGFWLIPIGFIALALYIKTRQPVASSVWLMGSTLFIGSGQLFSSYPEMSFIYYIFTILGLVGTIVSVYMLKP